MLQTEIRASCLCWLIENSISVNRYLDDHFPDILDHYYMWQNFYFDPVGAKSIIEDYYRSNDEKIIEIISFILHSNYLVSLICGNADSGKSSLLHYIGYLIKEFSNERIFYYEDLRLPDWADGSVWSLNEKEDCFMFFNEMAKAFPSREATAKENIQVSSNLLDNRHYGVKYIGCNIRLSMVDLNLVRSCNCFFYKYITPEVLMLDRKELITPLLLHMLPKNRNDKSEVLAVIDGRYIKFRYPLMKDFTDSLSKSRHLSDEEKSNIALSKYLSGMTPQEVQKYMRIRFRFLRGKDFYTALFKS